MYTTFQCIPCFIRQACDALEGADLGEGAAEALIRRILALISKLDWSVPPPVIARQIQRAIREATGDPDPYLRKKLAANATALALLPAIEKRIAASDDPFLAALQVSIAGNIIDLGAKVDRDIDVEAFLEGAFEAPIDPETARELQRAVASSNNVLFLADNAGEVVFDRPLLERIGPDKLTVAVRGSPTINDATLEDAARAGLCERFHVIPNGSDVPGTWLDDCSPDFVARFRSADLVIAKGQGNYETLSDEPRQIFFLFLVKCAVVSEKTGVPSGTYVVKRIATGSPSGKE
jgi:uncharacterized protein with ATP-grasp and redox domains